MLISNIVWNEEIVKCEQVRFCCPSPYAFVIIYTFEFRVAMFLLAQCLKKVGVEVMVGLSGGVFVAERILKTLHAALSEEVNNFIIYPLSW